MKECLNILFRITPSYLCHERILGKVRHKKRIYPCSSSVDDVTVTYPCSTNVVDVTVQRMTSAVTGVAQVSH